tara:strand:+ start:91 stop:1008 length:918 start_codon:yes stop_codon:yes gene_type:complete
MVVNMNQEEKYKAVIDSMDEYTYQWNPENAEDPSKPILKITKSSLGSHDWCPKKYDFSYIQRLPQDQTEAMLKGTVVHNAREDFFNDFDIAKAETMNNTELLDYCQSLFPIDDYLDIYLTIASTEAERFIEAKEEDKLDEYLPIVNEGLFDAEIIFRANQSKKFTLQRDYKIHLQGIIDRVFREGNSLIPLELKTGPWKDYKTTSMRKEMAFYQLMIESAPEEVLIKNGLTKDMKVTHWGWYYPVSNYMYVEEAKKRSMTSVVDGIAKLLHAYEQGIFAPKFYFKTCSHCSFFGICDAAQTDSWL